MTTVRHLLVTMPGAAANPAGAARLAGVIALLRRRACTPVAVLAADPAAVGAAHPELKVHAAEDLNAALQHCEGLVVAGAAHDESDFEVMARQVLAARLAGVPVALVAVEIGVPGTARSRAWLAEVLATAESVSAMDAASGARLQAVRGRRVEVAAAPELVLEPATVPRGGLLVDAALLASPVGAAMRDGLRAFQPDDIRTLGATAPGDTNWRAWWSALSSAAVFITTDRAAAVCALACGTVPVLCAAPEDGAVLVRSGLQAGLIAPLADRDTWIETLRTAQGRAGRPLATCVAPLRTLAWRALGPLADAARAAMWSAAGTSAPTRGLAADCCAALAHSRITAGDGMGALQVLEAHAAGLGREPAWVRARARVASLLGQDRDAVALLQQALEQAPLDATTRAELARAQLRAGDHAGARASWTELARLVPTDAAPWAELATLELLAGDRVTALRCFAEALGRDPEHAGVRRAVTAYFVSDRAGEAEFWRAVPGAARPGPAVAALKAPAV